MIGSARESGRLVSRTYSHWRVRNAPRYASPTTAELDAIRYVRTDCFGIPSSRKYDAPKLRSRVLDTLARLGMDYRLLVVRNQPALGRRIYCQFILEIAK